MSKAIKIDLLTEYANLSRQRDVLQGLLTGIERKLTRLRKADRKKVLVQS